MRQFRLHGLAILVCVIAVVGLFTALSAADRSTGERLLAGARSLGTVTKAPQLGKKDDGEAIEVTVTGTVFFNGIGDPPLGDVQGGDSAEVSFVVHTNDFVDGVSNTRGYVIDQSTFMLTLGAVEIGLIDPFPAGETPYFALADGIPVSDRFWVSTSPNSPGGVPLAQDPYQASVDLGYMGDTLDSLDILDALGTYDFDGLTSFGFGLWAIFPDNVVLGIDFEQMTIAEVSDKITICHAPPGNPGNARTITVSMSALPAHLAHGDTIGPCDEGMDEVQVTVTGTVFFNGIGDPPLGDVQGGDSAEVSFIVHPDDFVDGVDNTRGYVIDQSTFMLTLGAVEIGLIDPFPAGETPYFALADGIPVSDRFWVSTSPNSPGGVPLAQDPYQASVDLGYMGDTLDSLDILDALGTYDFDGLTSFGFGLWAIFPDNVVLGIDFEQMTIAEATD